jgi:hypothetical protein
VRSVLKLNDVRGGLLCATIFVLGKQTGCGGQNMSSSFAGVRARPFGNGGKVDRLGSLEANNRGRIARRKVSQRETGRPRLQVQFVSFLSPGRFHQRLI